MQPVASVFTGMIPMASVHVNGIRSIDAAIHLDTGLKVLYSRKEKQHGHYSCHKVCEGK